MSVQREHRAPVWEGRTVLSLTINLLPPPPEQDGFAVYVEGTEFTISTYAYTWFDLESPDDDRWVQISCAEDDERLIDGLRASASPFQYWDATNFPYNWDGMPRLGDRWPIAHFYERPRVLCTWTVGDTDREAEFDAGVRAARLVNESIADGHDRDTTLFMVNLACPGVQSEFAPAKGASSAHPDRQSAP